MIRLEMDRQEKHEMLYRWLLFRQGKGRERHGTSALREGDGVQVEPTHVLRVIRDHLEAAKHSSAREFVT